MHIKTFRQKHVKTDRLIQRHVYASLLSVSSVSGLYSFIHYRDLYSAPSRLLLRSAPDPCTAKKKNFETRVECVECLRLCLRPNSCGFKSAVWNLYKKLGPDLFT